MAKAKKSVHTLDTFEIKTLPAGRRVGHPKGFDYSSLSRRFFQKKKGAWGEKSKPCANLDKRASCPVQLFFDNGKTYLRFCTKKGGRGPSIEVGDPMQAHATAERVCACWKENKSFDKCDIRQHALMGLKSKKKARR